MDPCFGFSLYLEKSCKWNVSAKIVNLSEGVKDVIYLFFKSCLFQLKWKMWDPSCVGFFLFVCFLFIYFFEKHVLQ